MSIIDKIESITASRNTIRNKMITAGQATRTDKLAILANNLNITDTSDATATASDILSGKTAYVGGSKLIGTSTYDADTSDATATASDILSGVTAYVNGSKLIGTSTYDADTSDATATAEDIAEGKTAYVNGSKLIGTASGGGDVYDYVVTVNKGNSSEELLSSGSMIFKNNKYFNSPVTIGNHISITTEMFNGCSAFNQPVTIPDNVTNTAYMFFNCYNFNQPVNIQNNVTNCSCMFYCCYNFNQPIVLPSKVTSCSAMFSECSNFNASVDFSGLYNCADYYGMFRNCINLELNTITISTPLSGVSSYSVGLQYMFENCKKAKLSDIYIKKGGYGVINCYGMLSNVSSSYRHNIRFNSKYNNSFNINNGRSIIGSAISWTTMTNGFYNSAYNIYCYNNYSG